MSFLLNEDISSLHSSLPNSAEEMDPKQKIEAIFDQIKKVELFYYICRTFSVTEIAIILQTVFFYNTRMRQVNKRRLDTMAIVTDLGINNLDTRPFDRHLQVIFKQKYN